MPTAQLRGEGLHAWKGSSVLIVTSHGECGSARPLSGFYYREARFLRTLQLTINGAALWLCEAAAIDPARLRFLYVHPELATFVDGGAEQAEEPESTDRYGVPHRTVTADLDYTVRSRGLIVDLTIANHARHDVHCDAAIVVDADFLDIQETSPAGLDARAEVASTIEDRTLRLHHRHPRLPYESRLSVTGDAQWAWASTTLAARLHLVPREHTRLRIELEPHGIAAPDHSIDRDREAHLTRWRDRFTRVGIPGNRLAEDIVARNVRDVASFALLEGPRDEWLTLQAGMPQYPALFGRDALAAGWHSAFLDRGASLEATLTTLGRLQGTKVDEWRDEEPGRLPYQVRRGPQAMLDINPYTAYYADYVSPFMFVIGLTHLFAWNGERALLARHWDTARRALDWASTRGDRDGDGYLEYHTQSKGGTKNQGWKDSGDAIVYDDGRAVPSPIATCELQAYWYAALELMAVLSATIGAAGDARAYWQSARDLKARFNRDWWDAEEGSVALAMDPDKRLVRAVTSNVGHCIASGIISDEHLPEAVGRLFAPDMFSGWGVRTLSSSHAAYNPVSYHRGTVWAVEQATLAFGLRRFGFDARALEVTSALFDLAALYGDFRIPECVGGWPRSERPTPGAFPRANSPQLWNASAFPLLVHTLLGLQPVAPLELLIVDPVLPDWLPEVILDGVRLGGATATLRFWRDGDGASHADVVRKEGTLRLVHQPPPESLTAGIRDRMRALIDTVVH